MNHYRRACAPLHRIRPHSLTLPLSHPLTLYALVLTLLTGCVFDRQPATPRPPTPTPTPRPTPTETAIVVPIRPPTVGVPTAPRVTATAPAVEVPDVRVAGQIIYLASQGGRRDIMSLEANGSDRRRLVTGTYDAPQWSPDGSRFAAYGATVSGGRPNQLAVFNGDGQALARYALDGVGVGLPSWSPDGRAIFCQLRDPAETSGLRSFWIADDAGMRPLPLPEGAVPWRWMPNGRFAYLVYASGERRQVSQSAPLAVWSFGRADGEVRKEVEGVFAPLGWSPDGQTFYAFDGLLPNQPTGAVRATTLSAIDRRTGTTRTLLSADRLGSATDFGTPLPAGGVRWFEGAAVAPVAGQLLAWVRASDANSPGRVLVVVLDENGRVLLREALPPGAAPVGANWSAGGQVVAFVTTGNGNALHILAPGGRAPLVYPLAENWLSSNPLPSWSPDSRWLVLIGEKNELALAAAIGSPRLVTLGADAGLIAPAWRPANLR